MKMQDMRNYIATHPRYKNSMRWKVKCQTMPERQVVAIYEKFKTLDYAQIARDMLLAENVTDKQYHQIDIFEYLNRKENNND